MARASFETPDGDDIEIDPDEVVQIGAGAEPGTTVIELEDGSEVVVVATQLEAAAELGLNPLDYVEPEDDDELLEEIVDEEDEDS
jgi:hypothetical protein